MSIIAKLVPKSWVRALIAAVLAYAGGWATNAILAQRGESYELAPGITITVTDEVASAGTNAVAQIVGRLQRALLAE